MYHLVQSRAKMLSCFDIEKLNGICTELFLSIGRPLIIAGRKSAPRLEKEAHCDGNFYSLYLNRTAFLLSIVHPLVKDN